MPRQLLLDSHRIEIRARQTEQTSRRRSCFVLLAPLCWNRAHKRLFTRERQRTGESDRFHEMKKDIWPFRKNPSKTSLERQAEFLNLVELAKEVANENPRGLLDVMRLYIRPLQTDLLLSCAQRPKHRARAEIAPHELFMPGVRLELTDHWRYPQLDADGFSVDLAKDPVLPCPWHRDRYVNALATIGTGKVSGAWEQDRNHSAAVILPWGIACVFGGNHSMAVGILGGEGDVTPCEAWNMAGLLDKVRCDGLHYIEVQTGKPLCEVHNPKMGAVFEIGRLMLAHGITPLRKPAPAKDMAT